MSRYVRVGALLAFAAALFAAPATAAPRPNLLPRAHLPNRFVCDAAATAANEARCSARVTTDAGGTPNASTGPVGYGPAQFRAAYSLPADSAGAGQTIAIVDAYNDPTAESDLATYSSTFGLPACTTANGCFKKVNQTGGTNYPRKDGGWALEISLDVQVAHAVCPLCKVLLVEASSNSFANLLAAEDYAAAHASVVSNSWGGGESSGETTYDSHFNHPGVPITVSSGDNGYGVEYPASSRYVTAVGGTTLKVNADNTRASETAWNGAGSGCSAYETKPAWQADTGCARRTVADVSADADPSTGAAVYDSTPYCSLWGVFNCTTGWYQVGGTSLAAPLVASVYALAGNGGSTTYGSYAYSHTASLFDVLSGSNGTCTPAYLCTGAPGYDGPTGLGAPISTGGF